MASQVPCPSCDVVQDATNKYCMKCGSGMSVNSYCQSCSSPNVPNARFCANCGINLFEANEIPAGPGYVSNGEWNRAAGEFARQIELDEMEKQLGVVRSIRVPKGSLGVILQSGKVLRDPKTDAAIGLLGPGHQTTVGFVDALKGKFASLFGQPSKVSRSAFYLIDLRPIVVPIMVDVATGASRSELAVRVVVTAALRGDKDEDQASAIESFIEHVISGSESCTQDTVRQIVQPVVQSRAREVLRKHYKDSALDYENAQAELERELNRVSATGRLGFKMQVTVSLQGGLRTLDVQIGLAAELPATTDCESCEATIAFTTPMCPHCGEEQSPKKIARRVNEVGGAEKAELYTSDGQKVELDLIVRFRGEASLALESEDAAIEAALASAAAKHLRRVTYDSLVSEGGFSQLESKLAADVREIMHAFGLSLIEVVGLDLRSKGGEWLLGARADMEQEKTKLMIGREWLALEAEKLEFKDLNYEMVLRNAQSKRTFTFQKRQAELDEQLRTEKQDQDHEDRTASQSEDHEYRTQQRVQTHEDRTTTLDQDHEHRTQQRDLAHEDRTASVEQDNVRRTQQRDQEHEHLTQQQDLGHSLRTDQVDVDDAQQRVGLEDQKLDLEQKEVERELKRDDVTRSADQELKERDDQSARQDRQRDWATADELKTHDRAEQADDLAHERAVQRDQREFDRKEESEDVKHAREVQSGQAQFDRAEDKESAEHQMNLESRAAEHDVNLHAKAREARSADQRAGVDDASYAVTAEARAAADAQRVLDAAELERAEREQRLVKDAEQGQVDLEESRLDNRARRKMEKMRMRMEQQQAVIRQEQEREKQGLDHELAMKTSGQGHELAMKSADSEHKESLQAQENFRQIEKMRQASNLSPEQLLALKDGSLSEAAELAKALSGADEARAAAEVKSKDEQLKLMRETNETQMNFMREMMDRGDAKDTRAQERMDAKDARSQAVLEQALRSQQAVTERAVSGSASKRDEVVEAYQTGAEQAKEMANRSMDTMQNVAATAATAGSPQIIHTSGRKSTGGVPKVVKCGNCGKSWEPGANFCIDCGPERNW